MIGEMIIRSVPFLRYFSTKNIIPHQQLGRWKLNDNIQRKIDLANIDNCGDRLCGIPINKELKAIIEKYDKRWLNNNIQVMVDDYNSRWNDNLTEEEFKKKFTKFKL